MCQTRLSRVVDFNGLLVTDSTQCAAHVLYITHQPCLIQPFEIKTGQGKAQRASGLKGGASRRRRSLDTRYNTLNCRIRQSVSRKGIQLSCCSLRHCLSFASLHLLHLVCGRVQIKKSYSFKKKIFSVMKNFR